MEQRWSDSLDEDCDVDVLDREDIDLEEPKDFNLVGLNDDYTTVDFVIAVLKETCHRSSEDAARITQDIHKNGKGIMFTGCYDVVLTKSLQIKSMAKEYSFPFKTTVEET